MPSSSEVEHLTVNQNVAGSIPAQAAIGQQISWLNHFSDTEKIGGSSPSCPTNVDSSSNGRAFDCDSKGCEFDSHLSTQKYRCLAQQGEHLFYTQKVIGSIPITPTKHGEVCNRDKQPDCKSGVA